MKGGTIIPAPAPEAAITPNAVPGKSLKLFLALESIVGQMGAIESPEREKNMYDTIILSKISAKNRKNDEMKNRIDMNLSLLNLSTFSPIVDLPISCAPQYDDRERVAINLDE